MSAAFTLALVAVLVVLVLAACVGAWMLAQLLEQVGRLLLRIDMLEAQQAQLMRGLPSAPVPLPEAAQTPNAGEDMRAALPLGTVGNDFELPDLTGGLRRLDQWQGRRLRLLFLDPSCPFSRRLLPQLAAWKDDDDLALIAISRGEAEENRRLVEATGVELPVLLQEDWEVAELYRVLGTPTAYLLDEDGAIASERAEGGTAILGLLAASRSNVGGAAGAELGSQLTPREALPAGRRLKVRPLPAPGTPAPAFRLTSLNGDEVALADYRGRTVLLVFLDPACDPCLDVVTQLEEPPQRAGGAAILAISRRDPEANRAFLAGREPAFPLLLQDHWEISRSYGTLATPAAFLIDERGVLRAGPATGAAEIAAMAAAFLP